MPKEVENSVSSKNTIAEAAPPRESTGEGTTSETAPSSTTLEKQEDERPNPFIRAWNFLFNKNGFLHLDYFTLFWLFVVGSIIGLIFETAYHAIVFGGYESRAGLLWGPFSPIYGTGAVVLTLFLNRFYHSHNLIIFLISMVLGSAIEYITSWGMQVFWGAIAWDYTGTFGSLQGRTNFFFGVMWGMLGLLWVRIILPIVERLFARVNKKNVLVRTVTVLMSIFMAVNIVCTCIALNRAGERQDGIPATNAIQQFSDTYFPDSYLQERFENMTVTGKNN